MRSNPGTTEHSRAGRTAVPCIGDGAKEGNAHLAREMRKPYDYSFVG